MDHRVRRGTYKGAVWQCKGKEATLWCYPTGRCLAQFDDVETGYGFGKHDFATDNFDLNEPLDFASDADLA